MSLHLLFLRNPEAVASGLPRGEEEEKEEGGFFLLLKGSRGTFSKSFYVIFGLRVPPLAEPASQK